MAVDIKTERFTGTLPDVSYKYNIGDRIFLVKEKSNYTYSKRDIDESCWPDEEIFSSKECLYSAFYIRECTISKIYMNHRDGGSQKKLYYGFDDDWTLGTDVEEHIFGTFEEAARYICSRKEYFMNEIVEPKNRILHDYYNQELNMVDSGDLTLPFGSQNEYDYRVKGIDLINTDPARYNIGDVVWTIYNDGDKLTCHKIKIFKIDRDGVFAKLPNPRDWRAKYVKLSNIFMTPAEAETFHAEMANVHTCAFRKVLKKSSDDFDAFVKSLDRYRDHCHLFYINGYWNSAKPDKFMRTRNFNAKSISIF